MSYSFKDNHGKHIDKNNKFESVENIVKAFTYTEKQREKVLETLCLFLELIQSEFSVVCTF